MPKIKPRAAQGGCLCGAVRFEVTGPPSWVGICHCQSCRRATGGILVAAAGFPKPAVIFTGQDPATFASSRGVLRSFCRSCGTSIAYRNDRWPEDIHLFAGAFDDPHTLTPEFHIFAGEQMSWLHLSDHLPRFRTTPSAGDLLHP